MIKKNILLSFIILFITFSVNAQNITGKVFNDANNNSIQDGAEVGYPYVTVNAYAPGSLTPSATITTLGTPTPNVGEFTLTGLTSGIKYRIEFVTPAGYHDAAYGAALGHSSIQFALAGATTINYGIRYANECTINSNPRLVAGQSLNSFAANTGLLKSWNYNDRTLELQSNFQSVAGGYGTYAQQDIPLTAGIGTSTGMSFNSKTKHVYFASWAALPSVFPAPTAGYHSIQIANYSGVSNSFVDNKTLVDLSTIGLTTTASNQISTFPDNSAGTAGLGQVAVSGDGNFLYGVNLNDGNIFKLNISNVVYATLPITAPTSTDLTTITIPTSVTNAVGGVFRPFALKLKGNTLYIGGINDGSTSFSNANVEMVVLAMDLTTNTFTKIFSNNLNFTSGFPQASYGSAGIFGVTQSYWRIFPGQHTDFQPLFNSIEFDDYGAMLIGITNRAVYTSVSLFDAGYFVRAARNASGGYDLENAGVSGTFTSAARGYPSSGTGGPGNSDTYNTDGPGGKYFFENMIHHYHANVFTGGLYVLPGSGEVVAGVIDPIAFNEEGARYLNASTGVTIAGKAIQSGKGGTMTGTEAVCDPNPVEIGNRVWKDSNGNGIQDGNEEGVVGVTVVLCVSGNNTPVATAVTDANGNYLFSTAAGTSTTSSIYNLALILSSNYDIKVTSLGSSPLLTGYSLADLSNLIDEVAGVNSGNSKRNSDGVIVSGLPTIQIKLGASGENNYNYDFGFYKVPCSVTASVVSGDQSICLGVDPVAFTETTPASVSGIISYQWQSSTTGCNGTFTDISGANSNLYDPPAISSTTNYRLVVTNVDGANTCSANSNCLTITVNPLPIADAGSTQNLNCTTTSATIGTTEILGNTYSWSPSSGLNNDVIAQPIANPSSSTNYTVTVTNSFNCSASNAVSVNVNTILPTADAGSTQNLNCTTTSATIGTTAISGNTYSWSPTTALSDANIAQPTANPTVTTTYTVTVTGTNGCQATSTVLVNVNTTQPTVGFTGNMTVCNGSTTSITATGGTGYLWSNSDVTATTVVGVGSYTVTVTGSNGCTNTDVATINNVQGSVGNYVWIDDNANGLFDEAVTSGINGVSVELYKETSSGSNSYLLDQSTTTLNDGLGNPGYYNFVICESANYKVKFPTSQSAYKLTLSTSTLATDGNSDASQLDGFSPSFALDVNGSGNDKDNMTIDAGYYELASLGNYVWNDLDHDGVQDANEVGVAGISVTLYDDLGNPISTTLTDAYGYYLFDNLIPAYYTVGFTLPQNYVFTATSGTSETDAINSDVDVVTGNTTSIILSSGEHQMNIDAGIYFQPQNTATVGNYVWFDANADGIQDANEVGISGVTVTMYNNANEPVATTITDANGQYLFTNVTPGTYSVGFTSPIGMILSPNNGGVSTTDNSDANPSTGMTGTFVVNAGDNITYVDAGFTPQPSTTASLGDKVWYDVNQNGVQDNGELGVEGVTVTLFQSNGTSIIKATVTDAYGNYIFNNLAAGQYVVGFTNLPIDYVLTSTTGTNPATNSDANTSTAKTAIIDLSAGEHDMTWDAGIFNNIPTNNNSIGDYVWNDVDKDGVQDATEQGVSGITVTLYDNTNTPIATTSTNANGQYTFPDLPNGTYTVGFSNLPEGFVFSPSGNGTTSTDSDPNPSTGLTASVSLTGNTHITTLDAGINLGNPNVGTASLGDLVWYDINNNGLQDAGEAGVQDVTATLYASNGTIVLATTTTNALGYYVFTGLPAGDYIVGFTNLPVGFTITSKDANAQGIEGETNSDVNTATNKTDVISLALGQDKMSVDMGIVPPAGTAALGDLVWFDLNNDGLQTTGEPGVQGVTVTLYDNTNTAVATTTTDANGEYHFVGLTPATYSVGFSNLPTGYTFTTQSGVINDATNSDANVTTGMTASVTLASGDNNLNLDAGIKSTTVASVGDYVWYDINHDGIQDANEPGLGGILVTLYDNTNTPVASTITNPDGSYIFTNVTPGTYTMGFENLPTGMTFTTQETNPASNTGSNVNPSTGLTPSFTVTAGTHNPTIDAGLTTSPLAGLGNYVWFDNNRDGVQGTFETGVAGAIATLYASNGTTVLAQAITDGNGAYSFTNLPAGSYSVGFSNLPLGYVATQSNGTLNDATNSDMNPTTGKTTTATLLAGDYNQNLDAGIMKPIAQLGNYVWNDINKDGIQDNGEVGVAGITVTLFDISNAVVSTTITDAYGYYKFSPLEEGTYHVGFTLPANYVFTLPNATADAVDADVNPTTGITGDYVIVAGDSNMTVDAGIYFQQPTTASVGNYVWLDVNQDGIQNNGEEGISGVTVTLYNNAGQPVATMITNADGFYQFTDVTPGSYAVGFTPPVGLTFTQNNGTTSNPSNSDANPLTGMTGTITVNAGDEITYVDAGLYSLPVNVGGLGDKVWYDVNQDGVQNNGEIGVQGVTVTLYQADGTTTISTTTTDAYGNYIFNSLSQGQYVVGFSNLPIDYVLTTTTGTDSTSNSDANVGTGKTSIINLAQGQYNLTYDAGIYTTNSSNTNSIGDFVWFDLNKDGIQTSNESGAPGVTVTLYDNTNTIISVTSTNSDGAYLFPDLPNGTYYVGFSNLPVGYGFSQTGQGTTSTDSDPNTNTGLTSTVTLTGNTHITDLDAGIGKGNDPRIGKATLGDLVWYDLNNNGLQDNGESGVAGVLVTLYQGDGTTTIKTSTTDALGNYIFTNLDAGSFVVGFTNLPVGYTISPKNADAIGIEGELNSDVDNTTQKTDIISLATGEDKLSVDMGIAPPAGTASLGNLVWFDLNFDGLQSSGEPGVQGVSVTLYDNTNTAISTTTTNAAGEYYFIGLTPGTYSVGFDNIPSGYILTTQNADAAGINGALNSDANATTGLTSTVTLVAGDNNLNLDAGINSTTVASVGDYVWLDINQNGIQDPSENGVGGVLVTLYNNLGTSIASTITSPNGSYIFTNVIPGDYTIGFANLPLGTVFTIQETNPTSNTGSNVNPTTGFTPTFNVVAGTHNPTIDAGLTSDILSSLGNYVWHDFNEDGLQNATEPGVPGVLVTLYAADGTTVLANASTNGNGGYLFTNLLAGDYVVGFSNLPIGSTRTKNVGASVNDPANSDMNVNGKTSVVTLGAGEFNPYVDAGIYFGVPLGARKLIATTAIIEDVKTCKVNWYTVEETNTKDFIIERSIDGTNFVATGTSNASYQTVGNTNYTFNDDISAVVNARTIHYRIVLRDLDNKLMTSNVILVKQNNNTHDLMVYPAPFTDVIMMDYIATEATSVEAVLTDALGNVVIKVTKDIDKGLNTISFPNLSHLAKGSYFVKFVDINTNTKMVRKIVK